MASTMCRRSRPEAGERRPLRDPAHLGGASDLATSSPSERGPKPPRMMASSVAVRVFGRSRRRRPLAFSALGPPAGEGLFELVLGEWSGGERGRDAGLGAQAIEKEREVPAPDLGATSRVASTREPMRSCRSGMSVFARSARTAPDACARARSCAASGMRRSRLPRSRSPAMPLSSTSMRPRSAAWVRSKVSTSRRARSRGRDARARG